MATVEVEIEYEWLDEEDVPHILQIKADVEPFVPGYTAGPPDKCYPDEGGYGYITSIIGPDGKDWAGRVGSWGEDGIQDAIYGAYESRCDEARISAAEDQLAARQEEAFWD